MNEYIKVNISDISPTIFFFTDSLYTCNIDEHVKFLNTDVYTIKYIHITGSQD